MVFRFRNGYQVQIRDCGDKTPEELMKIAQKVVEDAVKLEKNIDTNTSFMPTKMKEAIKNEDQPMFDREYAFLMRDLDADLSDAHKNYPNMYRKEVIDKLIKQYEDALRMLTIANNVFYEDYYTPVEEKLNQLKNNWNRPDKRYRAHIEYADGEVTIKDFDDPDEARRDIEARIEFTKNGKNPVEVGYVIDNRTGDVIKTVNPETKVEDAVNEEIPDDDKMKVIAYIEYVDLGAREKTFDDMPMAKAELNRLLDIAKKVGEPVARALILNADTKNVIEEVYKDKDLFQDSKDVKDAPPPYYDPTDYPTIKSNYSPERLKKELRHFEKKDPIINEFNDVIDEIDELIGRGTDALIEAGWSKDDARRAIAARYMDLEKELRRNKQLELARELHAKIRALEKAWDLKV